jgi:hypothetical protein
MVQQIYVFSFAPRIPLDEVQGTLRLAVLAAEAIHGEADVLVDAVHNLDVNGRKCCIDAVTPAGRDLLRLFSSFVRREFGAGAFRIERVGTGQTDPAYSA